MSEHDYLGATLWTRADWGRERAGDWQNAVRIGAPIKAGREVIKRGLTTAAKVVDLDKGVL